MSGEMVSQRLVLSPLAILLRPGVPKTLEMKKGESILSDSAQGEHQERLLRHIGCILLPHIFTSFCLTKSANKHKWSQVFSISECTAALLHFRHYHGLKKGGKKMSSNFTLYQP